MIRVGAPKIIDFLHKKNLCDWLPLGFNFEHWQRKIAGRDPLGMVRAPSH